MSNSIIYDLVTLLTQQNNAQINLITHCLCFNKWNYWCYSFKKCFQLLNYKTGLSLFISTLESGKVPMSVTQLFGFQCLLINTSNTQHWNYPFGYQSVSFSSASQKTLQYQYQSIMPQTITILFLGFKLHQTVLTWSHITASLCIWTTMSHMQTAWSGSYSHLCVILYYNTVTSCIACSSNQTLTMCFHNSQTCNIDKNDDQLS